MAITYPYPGLRDFAGYVTDGRRPAAAEGAFDPVCGMTVDPCSALWNSHGGRDYSFCCPGGQEAFDRSPDAYASEVAGVTDH